jgi:hypothetical protein
MEKTRFVSGRAAFLLVALFLAFETSSIHAIGFDNSRSGFQTKTGGNRLLPLGAPNPNAPQVPSILQPSTKEVTLDPLVPQGLSSGTTVDLNGDGKTDFAVTRNTGGGPSGQLTWFFDINGSTTNSSINWGVNTDWVVMEDFDGDGKDDVTVWRPGVGGTAAFYIFQSATNTARIVQFGQNGDNPGIVGDYDNDGKADPAVYRQGTPSVWYYLGSATSTVTAVAWGASGDAPAPGDWDGDGKNDFGIYRSSGTGQLDFWRELSNGSQLPVVRFGTAAEVYVPGDYDGDHKTDIATFRLGGSGIWSWISSANGNVTTTSWGAGNDFPVQGDYDGDGKTDIAIWRPVAGQESYWARLSSGGLLVFQWGSAGDFPVASYNVF